MADGFPVDVDMPPDREAATVAELFSQLYELARRFCEQVTDEHIDERFAEAVARFARNPDAPL